MNRIVEHIVGNPAFGPQDIDAMSTALDAVCKLLNIRDNRTARELIALRIIDLAQRGLRSADGLQATLLAESHGGSGC